MASTLPESLKESLQEIEIIFNYLADANNLSDCDGEHVRAILARTGHEKVIRVQNMMETSETG